MELYERVGFDTVRQFPAYVWEGFPGPQGPRLRPLEAI